jgi:hypothetical protein
MWVQSYQSPPRALCLHHAGPISFSWTFSFRLSFRVTANFDRVNDCNCSICTKKGFLHLIVPPGQFQLVSGKDDLTTYEFNTNTAKHTFCKHCGIHPFYVPRSDQDKIDVNVRCLDNINLAAIAPKPFDGKNWEAAMQKRAPWR